MTNFILGMIFMWTAIALLNILAVVLYLWVSKQERERD